MEHDSPPRRETPRSEPEIIPPGSPGPQPRGARIWVSMSGADGRAFAKPPGPFTIAATLIGALLAAALLLMVVLGALLFWIPIVAIVLAGFVAVGLFKGYFRRMR